MQKFIKINEKDKVAVALAPLSAGMEISVGGASARILLRAISSL